MKAETSPPPAGAGNPASRSQPRDKHDDKPPARPRRAGRVVGAIAAVLIAAALGYLGVTQYRTARLASEVRTLFAERRYDEARRPLDRWIRDSPRSGEARYYRGWLALHDQDPRQAVESVEQAQRLGFDRSTLEVLVGIYQARAGRINLAEPILRAAFDRDSEPRDLVAGELARIYLSTYRFPYAGPAIERYRELVPSDPQPYMWSNEINTRSGATPALLIRNYRAALERDPDLDRARLGLAEQLSKDRRFDEAEQEYRTYLKRNPKDVSALVGLGRNAFQSGDIAGATREFEAALAIDPDQHDALKELAQLDLRFGRFDQARRRLERLSQLDPYDHEISYSYAQALRLSGHAEKARIETARAARLRKEHEQIVQLRFNIVKDPNDVPARYQVARWMFEHGHADEGLKWAREILRADPHHAGIHRVLAEYYAAHGDPGLANYHRSMASSGQDAR
ncbi:MAG: tetratricopeptide repeat protein [Isosphaeraceae bacterium]